VNRIVVDIPGVILQRCHPTQNHAMVVVLLPTGLAPR
jgi:hypothetical protein